MEKYIYSDLIKYVISDYVNYYSLIYLPSLFCNKHRICRHQHSQAFDFYSREFKCNFKIPEISNSIPIYKDYDILKVDNLYILTGKINMVTNTCIDIQNSQTSKYYLYTILYQNGTTRNSKTSLTNNISKFTNYHTNGNKIESYTLKNKLLDGRYIKWYYDLQFNTLYSICNYTNGINKGLQTYYYDNGIRCKEYTIANNCEYTYSGFFIIWDKDANIISKDLYIYGKLIFSKIDDFYMI
jgi:antitoxin component YwqK of YwqJK toxin-antitoxin module